MGRPKKHENAAAKQKAYRKNLKARGLVVKTYLISNLDKIPLKSEIIDLSEVKQKI